MYNLRLKSKNFLRAISLSHSSFFAFFLFFLFLLNHLVPVLCLSYDCETFKIDIQHLDTLVVKSFPPFVFVFLGGIEGKCCQNTLFSYLSFAFLRQNFLSLCCFSSSRLLFFESWFRLLKRVGYFRLD